MTGQSPLPAYLALGLGWGNIVYDTLLCHRTPVQVIRPQALSRIQGFSTQGSTTPDVIGGQTTRSWGQWQQPRPRQSQGDEDTYP